MSAHRFHPDLGEGDPPGALLFDGCLECEHKARQPLITQTPDRLGQLWKRMVEVEHSQRDQPGGGGMDHYLTGAEGLACRALYTVAVFIERTHPAINPWVWPWEVRELSDTVWARGATGVFDREDPS